MKTKRPKTTRGKTPGKRPRKPARPIGRPKFLFDQLTPCEHSPKWWRVLESRVTKYGCRRRRWKCLDCGTRWTTRENEVVIDPVDLPTRTPPMRYRT